jgi:hypothetical protein
MTTFKGKELNEGDRLAAKRFLEGKFRDLLYDIDEQTDSKGDIILATRKELERYLEANRVRMERVI